MAPPKLMSLDNYDSGAPNPLREFYVTVWLCFKVDIEQRAHKLFTPFKSVNIWELELSQRVFSHIRAEQEVRVLLRNQWSVYQ